MKRWILAGLFVLSLMLIGCDNGYSEAYNSIERGFSVEEQDTVVRDIKGNSEIVGTNEGVIQETGKELTTIEKESKNNEIDSELKKDLSGLYNTYCEDKKDILKDYQTCKTDVIKFFGGIDNCKNDMATKDWRYSCMQQWAKYSGDVNNCKLIPEREQKGCYYGYSENIIHKRRYEDMPLLDFTFTESNYKYWYVTFNYSSKVDALFRGYYHSSPSIYVSITTTKRDSDEFVQFLRLFSSEGEFIADFRYTGIEFS